MRREAISLLAAGILFGPILVGCQADTAHKACAMALALRYTVPAQPDKKPKLEGDAQAFQVKPVPQTGKLGRPGYQPAHFHVIAQHGVVIIAVHAGPRIDQLGNYSDHLPASQADIPTNGPSGEKLTELLLCGQPASIQS